MTKIDGYLIHSLRRAASRYGLEIEPSEYEALSAKIASGDPNCFRLSEACSGREKWAIWYKGEWMPLIFDPSQARIVTILPKRELRPFKGDLPW